MKWRRLLLSQDGLLEFNGECHAVAVWEKLKKLPRCCVARRLGSGWSVRDALTTPLLVDGNPIFDAANKRSPRNITFNGETHSMKEWASRLGLSGGTLSHRLRDGWSIERALTTPKVKQRSVPRDIKIDPAGRPLDITRTEERRRGTLLRPSYP